MHRQQAPILIQLGIAEVQPKKKLLNPLQAFKIEDIHTVCEGVGHCGKKQWALALGCLGLTTNSTTYYLGDLKIFI
jgi:hypothetical protein